MNKAQLLHTFKRQSPTILTVVGSVGVVATAVLTAKATPKALYLLDEAKKEKGEDLTKLEVVKVAGPAYIPAITVGITTIACVFGANVLNKRQQASVMSAYAFLDTSYKEYKKKFIEMHGEEAHEQLKAEIAKDKFQESDVKQGEEDELLFYDEWGDRYFNSTMEKVIKAEYDLNRKIQLWGGAYLNEFYEFLDIPPVPHGAEIGWSVGSLESDSWSEWLDFEHKKVMLDETLECRIISASCEPRIDFDYY